jgi:hypothetical protein
MTGDRGGWTTAAGDPMVVPFPTPGPALTRVMARLQMAVGRPPTDQAEIMAVMQLPRPWDPGTCTGIERAELWRWLDDVATWINTQHLWNVTGQGVPECWPDHPHVVHDLAVVASARLFTTMTATPQALDEWHRYTLPAFLDRLHGRLGEGCPPGRHAARPRHDRDQRLTTTEHRRRQEGAFRRDLISSIVTLVPYRQPNVQRPEETG